MAMATLRDCKCGTAASRNDSNSGELLRIQTLKSGTPIHPFTLSHRDAALRMDSHRRSLRNALRTLDELLAEISHSRAHTLDLDTLLRDLRYVLYNLRSQLAHYEREDPPTATA